MSTLCDVKKCVRCGRAAYSEWRPTSGEEHIYCCWCGYAEHLDVVPNAAGYNLVKRVVPAYGVYYACYKNGKADFFAFKKPSLLKKKILSVLLSRHCVDKERSYLTDWNESKQKVTALFGKEEPIYTETERDFY